MKKPISSPKRNKPKLAWMSKESYETNIGRHASSYAYIYKTKPKRGEWVRITYIK